MNHSTPEASMSTAPTIAAATAITGEVSTEVSTEPVLTAHGIEKAYRRSRSRRPDPPNYVQGAPRHRIYGCDTARCSCR
jgi:hypothetical protein